MSRNRSPRRALAAAAGALFVTAALAGPAAAHVTVSADDPSKGAPDTVLTFRVPNEEDAATTVKVQIKLPAKTPIASVKPQTPPGWTVSTTPVTFDPPITTDDGTLTEGVGSVTFTADQGTKGIPVGGFEAFTLLVGPLPEDADSLAFPTVQTYSDGTVSNWVDPVVEGQDEPESPAPTLTLTAAGGAEPAGTASAEPTPAATPADAAAPATSTSDSSGGSSSGLGIAGLVLGAAGAVLGGLAFARSGRRPAAPSAD
jgi:uncharacterized protein YcnI